MTPKEQIILTLKNYFGKDGYETEYKFHHKRKWRFDYAVPKEKIAVEYEGGVFSGGRHFRGMGAVKDCEKYRAAAILGWAVLRYTVVDSGQLDRDLCELFNLRWIK